MKVTVHSLFVIKTRVEGAFKPLECRAHVYDYGRKLRFKVFDKDYDIAFETSDLVLTELLNGSFLAEIIEKARSEILARRFRLNFGDADAVSVYAEPIGNKLG